MNGRAVMIRGPSGSGKSALALSLIATGAGLVADDRVVLTRDGDHVLTDAPDTIRGLIEARGLGILRADPVGPATLALIVDLNQGMGARLPEDVTEDVLGVTIPCVGSVLAPAIRQYLIGGRAA